MFFDPEDGQQTRIDKIMGTVQDTADTAIGSINKTASDTVENIGKAEESINESVTAARGSASPYLTGVGLAFRNGNYKDSHNVTWNNWYQIAFTDGLPDKSALANAISDIASLSTRVQALEARINSLGTN